MPISLWNLRSNWPTPFEKRRLRPISAHNVSTVGDSEKRSITTNIKSTTGFPTSHRWSAYVTPKCPKGWLKERVFRFLSKSQPLIVSSAVDLLSRPVSQTSDGRPQCWSRITVDCRRDLYLAARPSRRNYLITIWCGSVSGLRESWLLPPFTRAFWISSHRHSEHWAHTVTTLVTTAKWRHVWNRVRTTAQWTFQT